MENKKFNFVLLEFNAKEAALSSSINAYALEDFGCDGIEEFALEEERVDEILGERAYSGGDIPESLIDEVQAATFEQNSFTFKYFFYEGEFESNCAEFVFFIKENYPEIPLYTAQKDFEDWNAEWKKFYTPIHVSKNLEIIPEWLRDREKKSKNQVYIYPGMGFGTGTHETTFLCLSLLDQIIEEIKPGDTCLDFGCGSGILGIAAIKLKRAQVTFCDIDTSALDNCVQNLVLNFEGEDLKGNSLVLRDRYNPTRHKLVFANILEHVLIIEQQAIMASLASGGFLIVSGILNHQVDSILDAYSYLHKVDIASKGDWSAILFKAN